MGKRYYCDYCDKTMACTQAIIKTHLKGLLHQKLVQEHYQIHKAPEVILAEESQKKPCNRFHSGECPFGIMCRFSHYTQEQLNYLKQIVASKSPPPSTDTMPCFQDIYLKFQQERSIKPGSESTTALIDPNGVTHQLPWIYNINFDNYTDLPQSLKRITIDNFNSDMRFDEWG